MRQRERGEGRDPDSHKEWRIKKREADDDDEPAASIRMVFILAREFKAPQINIEAEEEAMTQLNLGPMQATFEKPSRGVFRSIDFHEEQEVC